MESIEAILALSILLVPFLVILLTHHLEQLERPARAVARKPESRTSIADSMHATILRQSIQKTNQAQWETLVRARLKPRVGSDGGDGFTIEELAADTPGARIYVIRPRGGQPYWLRCNRHIEVIRYCRRVHPDGYELAPWSDPLLHGMRVVDLIGER